MTYITYTTRQTVAAQGMDSGGLSPQNDAQPPPQSLDAQASLGCNTWGRLSKWCAVCRNLAILALQ